MVAEAATVRLISIVLHYETVRYPMSAVAHTTKPTTHPTPTPTIYHYHLRKFNMNRIRDGSIVVILGRRESGKTTLIREILRSKPDSSKHGTCVVPTIAEEALYKQDQQNNPSFQVISEYSPAVVDAFVKERAMNMKMNMNESNPDNKSCLVLDNCLFDNSWSSDANIKRLFANSRSYRTMLLISLGDTGCGIPPVLRMNTDFVFLCRDNVMNTREKLYKQWAGIFPDFDTFCQVMDQCTEHYECLVIDNTVKSNKIEDQVFWYRSPFFSPSPSSSAKQPETQPKPETQPEPVPVRRSARLADKNKITSN